MTHALQELTGRVRDYLDRKAAVTEKAMFGARCVMTNGNMVVGVLKEGALLARVGRDAMDAALARPGVSRMDMNGRTMTGFVVVDGDVIEDDEALAEWLDECLAFAMTLPAK